MFGLILWAVFWFGCGWLASEIHATCDRRRIRKEDLEFRTLNRIRR